MRHIPEYSDDISAFHADFIVNDMRRCSDRCAYSTLNNVVSEGKGITPYDWYS